MRGMKVRRSISIARPARWCLVGCAFVLGALYAVLMYQVALPRYTICSNDITWCSFIRAEANKKRHFDKKTNARREGARGRLSIGFAIWKLGLLVNDTVNTRRAKKDQRRAKNL